VHVTEGSTSNTRCVREAGHASCRRERRQQLEEGGIPPRRRGARGRRADVEPDVEHHPEQQEYMDMEQEQPDVELQQMEEQELEKELQAMKEEMEGAKPQRRRKKKVVDPEPLDDYPGGAHETGLLWRYHVHVARKAADGEVLISVKLTYFISETACLCAVKFACLFTVKFVCEAMSLNSLY
jgi:hypothetical protein